MAFVLAVFPRKILGDIFAKDMYHKTSLKLYFYKFKRNTKNILPYEEDKDIDENMAKLKNLVVFFRS